MTLYDQMYHKTGSDNQTNQMTNITPEPARGFSDCEPEISKDECGVLCTQMKREIADVKAKLAASEAAREKLRERVARWLFELTDPRDWEALHDSKQEFWLEHTDQLLALLREHGCVRLAYPDIPLKSNLEERTVQPL